MAQYLQSQAYTRMFLLVQSADHVSGLTGASPTVTLSKAGGSFASAGGTVTEVANGWYKIVLTTTDTNTLGDLAFHVTATSGDPTDFVDQIIATDPLVAGTTLTNAGIDAIFNRATTNWETSPVPRSLGGAVIAATHKAAETGSTVTVYKSDDATTFCTRTVVEDATLNPIGSITKQA